MPTSGLAATAPRTLQRDRVGDVIGLTELEKLTVKCTYLNRKGHLEPALTSPHVFM